MLLLAALWHHRPAQSLPQLACLFLRLSVALALRSVWVAANIHWFQALYYLASFFAQYGPNCTTWLIAGELIPTDARAMAHGWAAAVGELLPVHSECVRLRLQHKASHPQCCTCALETPLHGCSGAPGGPPAWILHHHLSLFLPPGTSTGLAGRHDRSAVRH